MAIPDNLCGHVLGEFVLRELIGEGGFGAVYRCDQPLMGRAAVVKVLHRRLHDDDEALQRFKREALFASRLNHPYAAHVYAFGVEPDDGLAWIAMEFVQGVTLDRWLEKHGPLTLDELVPLFDRVAEVVQAAHEQGIVHRDLKPSNVMVIERAGRLLPKLLDLGIAKLLSDVGVPAPSTTPDAPGPGAELPADDQGTTVSLRSPASAQRLRKPRQLTRSSAMMGSPPYMAPEQWAAPTGVGPAADLYSLGVMAFEALTGHTAFQAETADELCELHRTAPIPPLGPGFSPTLDRLFQRALAKRPEDRFEGALKLTGALRAELEGRMRAQIRSSARQWHDRGRPSGLLWRDQALAELELWMVQSGARSPLTTIESEFIDASRRHETDLREAKRRRAAWIRRGLIFTAGAIVVAAVLIRAVMHTQMAEQAADISITTAEMEQGRQALLHGDPAEARTHLATAYERGDRSSGTEFMLARALQPQLAERARFAAVRGRMLSAIFSRDGRRIVTTDDTGARIWDADSARLLFDLPHGDTVYQALYSPDGSKLITAGRDNAVRIWDAASGTLVRRLSPTHGQWRLYAIAVSPDGRLVAAIDATGALAQVWDAVSGAAIAEFAGHASEYPALTFSADGRWLATTDGDDVHVFDASTWSPATTIAVPRVRGLAIDPTGPRLVTGTEDGDVAIWEIPSGTRLHHLREIGEPVDAVAFSPDGRSVATAERNGAAQIWDANNGRLQRRLGHRQAKILALEFDPSSRLVLAAGADGTVVVSDVAQGMTVTELEGPKGVVRDAHFDPSSRRIVGASWDGSARIWDATSPYRRWSSPPIAEDCGLATSLEPDRRYVAVGCRDHATRVWDTARDELLAELPAVTPVGSEFSSAFPAVSFGGDRAAIARGNTVEV